MNWRFGLSLAVVVGLAAGCATGPTAAGRAALRDGRPSEAVAHFQQALTEDPGRVDALIGLGISRYRLGAYDEAVAALGDAVTRAPGDPLARLYLALAYIRKHDDAKTQEHLSALRLLPIEPRLGALVGQALDLLQAGNPPDPVRTYLVASLDYGAEWSRDIAETRLALSYAQTAWDPFWARPYIIRCRHC
jgi:tetratricopeptide (TPR) repeat protein